MKSNFLNIYIAFYFFGGVYFLVFLGQIILLVFLKHNKVHSLKDKHKTKWQTEKQEYKAFT